MAIGIGVDILVYKGTDGFFARVSGQDIPISAEVAENINQAQGTGGGELPDIEIGRSVGAKAKNYDIVSPDGEMYKLAEGTRITDVRVIAGNGRDRQIDMIDVLVDEFGGNPLDWQKCKGYGYIEIDGEIVRAELHWYQEPTVGKVEFKIKEQPGGEWFFYED